MIEFAQGFIGQQRPEFYHFMVFCTIATFIVIGWTWWYQQDG